MNQVFRWFVFLLLTPSLTAYAADELPFPALPFVKNPARSYAPRPAYPPDARRNNVSGSVQVALAISSDGQITERKVILSEPPGIFDKVVLEALNKWLFQPYVVDSKPTDFQTVVVVRFETAEHPTQPAKFIWQTDHIQAEIRSGSLSRATRVSRYLHLKQELVDGELGWSMMNVLLPDQWSIREVSVGNGSVRLVTTDGEVYQLTQDNAEKVQNSIIKSYPVSNERLLQIWQELALVVSE